MPRKRASVSPLSPYPELIDLCHAKEYRAHLEHGKDGWTLDVFHNGGLIARGTSTKTVPHCFPELAAKAAAGLTRSRRR